MAIQRNFDYTGMIDIFIPIAHVYQEEDKETPGLSRNAILIPDELLIFEI